MYLYYRWCECVDKVMTNRDHSMSSNLDASVIATNLGSWFFAERILQTEILVLNHLVRELNGLADFCHWCGPQQGIIQSSPEFFTWSFLFILTLWIYGHLWPLDSLDLFPWCLWHHTLKVRELPLSSCSLLTTWGKNTAHSWTALQRGRRRVYMCHTCRSLQQNWCNDVLEDFIVVPSHNFSHHAILAMKYCESCCHLLSRFFEVYICHALMASSLDPLWLLDAAGLLQDAVRRSLQELATSFSQPSLR